MKDSVKANMIVFLIIAVVAFCISTSFANLTVTEDNDSYKLIPIENDSFEPNYINAVPTYVPPVENHTDNTTDTNSTDWNDTYDDDYNDTLDDLWSDLND